MVNELYCPLGNSGLADGPVNQYHQGGVGAQALPTPAQQASVARLEAQRCYVHRHGGAALVDAADDPQGDPALVQVQAVGQGGGLDGLPHRVGQGGHAAHVLGHAPQPLRSQKQAVQHGLPKTVGAGRAVVLLVGFQNAGLVALQGLGDVYEGLVFHRSG